MTAIRHIPFKIWFFLFSVSVLAFSLLHLQGVNAQVDQESRFELYSRDNIGLRAAIKDYHNNMNDLVNDYLERLLSGEGVVEPPVEGGVCDEKNVSTYCLSLRMVDEYEAFRQALNKTHRPLCTDPNEEADFALQSTEYLLSKCADRQQLIDDQINVALQTMDVTLGVYNEVQVMYPLHVQYQGLIEDLEEYRDSLADLRRQIEKYPKIFTDVITTECT